MDRSKIDWSLVRNVEEAEMDAERVLPEAPHWNGVGKYGPALSMDNCTLHIMSRGFGAKDGDGYLTFDPDEFDWERDDEGSNYVVVPVNNSDLLFLRDHLNALFPPRAYEANRTDVEELREALADMGARLAALVHAAEPREHNQGGSSMEHFKAHCEAVDTLIKYGFGA